MSRSRSPKSIPVWLHDWSSWPSSEAELGAIQEELGRASPENWMPDGVPSAIAGCFVCFEPGEVPGGAGERGWAAASLVNKGEPATTVVVEGRAGSAYQPGLLALREGALLAAAVRVLPEAPEVLLVNATGRDHPRKAGLAVHLGAVLALPTIGVTERPLVATGEPPGVRRGSTAPLVIEGDLVGWWVRTRTAIRPVAAHAGWCTHPDTAALVVLSTARKVRTPAPIRWARRAARLARARAGPT